MYKFSNSKYEKEFDDHDIIQACVDTFKGVNQLSVRDIAARFYEDGREVSEKEIERLKKQSEDYLGMYQVILKREAEYVKEIEELLFSSSSKTVNDILKVSPTMKEVADYFRRDK